MKLIAPAQLTDRLQRRGEQLDRLAQTMADTVAVWRARMYRHRIAIAVLGGGIAGASLAVRGRSLVRAATQLIAALIRAAALSVVARARVRNAVSRAVRTLRTP
jgi:acetyl-CoA carboxylase beta subunit